MNDLNFLIKLRREEKLQMVESSDEMKESYLTMAQECLTSAKLLQEHKLYKNSIATAYYTMYNALTALLFKIGIKCEIHNGSIAVFRTFFKEPELVKLIVFGKEERRDKQYYPTSKDNPSPTEVSTKDMITKAETFLVKMKLLINKINNEDIKKIRNEFQRLVN